MADSSSTYSRLGVLILVTILFAVVWSVDRRSSSVDSSARLDEQRNAAAVLRRGRANSKHRKHSRPQGARGVVEFAAAVVTRGRRAQFATVGYAVESGHMIRKPARLRDVFGGSVRPRLMFDFGGDFALPGCINRAPEFPAPAADDSVEVVRGPAEETASSVCAYEAAVADAAEAPTAVASPYDFENASRPAETDAKTEAVLVFQETPLPVDVAAGEYRVVTDEGGVRTLVLTESDLICCGAPRVFQPQKQYVLESDGVTYYFIRVRPRGPETEREVELRYVDDSTSHSHLAAIARGLGKAARGCGGWAGLFCDGFDCRYDHCRRRAISVGRRAASALETTAEAIARNVREGIQGTRVSGAPETSRIRN